MVLDGTGSVCDDNGWYLVSWYCLVLGGTGSAKGLYACIYWMPQRLTDNRIWSYSACLQYKVEAESRNISKKSFRLNIKTAARSLSNNFFSPLVLNCEPSDGQSFKDSLEGMGRVSLAQDDTGLVRKVSESIVISI